MDNFIPGLLPSTEDARDYSICTSASPLIMPEKIYIDYLPVAKKQKYGTCAAQTGSYISERFSKERMSAPFLYGYRDNMQYKGVGMYYRDLMNTLVDVGSVKNDLLPEECEIPGAIEQVNMKKSSLLKAASENKAIRYARVYTQNEVDTALLNGYPVAISVNVYGGILDSSNRYTCPATGGTLMHAMSIWGKDRPFKYLDMTFYRVLNSWGETWGDNGWCWMTWEDISRINDMWVVVDDIEDSNDITQPSIVRRTIKRKSRGEEVSYLQMKLNVLGYAAGAVDGVFGRGTESAVKMFQRKMKLDDDGIVGRNTWNALDEYVDATIMLEGYSPKASLKLYKDPKTKQYSGDKLLNNTYVVILEATMDMCKIKNDTIVGYVNRKYLKISK